MASKVPKFGAWEGGENYTVYFDNARKKKTNGPMINPNDPQENPDMFTQNGGPAAQPSRAADPKGQQSQAPQFGAWDNGDNVGYTAYFENKRKTKSGQPTVPANEPQMNRDMHPPAQPQARPQTAKLETQQAPKQESRSKVPQFGAWEGEGEVAYTQSFDNVRKNNNKNGRTVTPEPSDPPPAKEGHSKVPQFGAWEEGDNGAYTAYFENARKTKNVGPVLDNVEPQLNRDVNTRARPHAVGTKNKIDDKQQLSNASRGSNSSVETSDSAMRHGRQNAGGQSPIHQKAGKLQQKPPASRGSQTPDRGAAIPAWGVWNTDPSQAEGFTGAFTRAKEERNTPLNSNVPPRHNQPQSSQDEKRGCCFGWF